MEKLIWIFFFIFNTESVYGTRIRNFFSFHKVPATWDEAYVNCKLQARSLVKIDNLAKQMVLNDALDTWKTRKLLLSDPVWIGGFNQSGYDTSSNSGYYWHDCVPMVDFTNWMNDAPPISQSGSQCVLGTNLEFKWMSDTCDRSLPYICEKTNGECYFEKRGQHIILDESSLQDISPLSTSECKQICMDYTTNNMECQAFISDNSSTCILMITPYIKISPYIPNLKYNKTMNSYIKRCFDVSEDHQSPATSHSVSLPSSFCNSTGLDPILTSTNTNSLATTTIPPESPSTSFNSPTDLIDTISYSETTATNNTELTTIPIVTTNNSETTIIPVNTSNTLETTTISVYATNNLETITIPVNTTNNSETTPISVYKTNSVETKTLTMNTTSNGETTTFPFNTTVLRTTTIALVNTTGNLGMLTFQENTTSTNTLNATGKANGTTISVNSTIQETTSTMPLNTTNKSETTAAMSVNTSTNLETTSTLPVNTTRSAETTTTIKFNTTSVSEWTVVSETTQTNLETTENNLETTVMISTHSVSIQNQLSDLENDFMEITGSTLEFRVGNERGTCLSNWNGLNFTGSTSMTMNLTFEGNSNVQSGTIECICRLLDKQESLVPLQYQYLLINQTNLSSNRRKLTSAPDERISAKSIGALGISVLFMTFFIVVFSDVTNFCRHNMKEGQVV